MTFSILIRDSLFGQVIRHLSGRRLFKHKEDYKDYIPPEKYLHGKIEIDWEEDDPVYPKNWPTYIKMLFLTEVCVLTVAVYTGASVYTPATPEVQEKFGVGQVVAILPLSLFCLGYGIGPCFFSPLSENPALGRTGIYIVTLFVFLILQIPTALCNNIAGLLILRFLAGVLGSPVLANGGASVADVYPVPTMPLAMSIWSMFTGVAPVFGPLFGGILVQLIGDYRWTFWFMAILSAAVLLLLVFFLPESSNSVLLYRRAERLKRITGNPLITSPGHKQLADVDTIEILKDTCLRPFVIVAKEPIVLSIDLYLGLCYAMFYLFFETFPIVFQGIYGFNLIQLGFTYFSVISGGFIGCVIYGVVIYKTFTIPMRKDPGSFKPEEFLPFSIVVSAVMPISMFILGWSSTASAHWFGACFGAALFTVGAFGLAQSLFNYMAFSFPRYIASVFASNFLARGSMACAFPLFANAMYANTGSDKYPVGWGCTILGFIGLAMIAIPVTLWKFGVQLRARSEYAN